MPEREDGDSKKKMTGVWKKVRRVPKGTLTRKPAHSNKRHTPSGGNKPSGGKNYDWLK